MDATLAIGAVLGALMIAVIVWKIARHGIPKDNGKLPDDNWPSGA